MDPVTYKNRELEFSFEILFLENFLPNNAYKLQNEIWKELRNDGSITCGAS